MHSQKERVRWEAFGLTPEHAAYCAPVQGGHVVFNLATAAWPTVVLAHWLNQHSDYSYAHGFGDQDCLRVAIAAGQVDHANLGMATWMHPAYVCELAGAPLIVHRCRGKSLLERTWHLPGDARYFGHVADWMRRPPPPALPPPAAPG